LDQTILLGLGNIYANEVLFAAKIHPGRIAKEVSLDEAASILKNSVTILNESIAMGGTTIHSFTSGNKVPGSYQEKLKVHGREGQPCFVCGTKIMKIFVGGRGTYFCPTCQSH
jgi:formamidopyrimidine-DNA glycosylase